MLFFVRADGEHENYLSGKGKHFKAVAEVENSIYMLVRARTQSSHLAGTGRKVHTWLARDAKFTLVRARDAKFTLVQAQDAKFTLVQARDAKFTLVRAREAKFTTRTIYLFRAGDARVHTFLLRQFEMSIRI